MHRFNEACTLMAGRAFERKRAYLIEPCIQAVFATKCVNSFGLPAHDEYCLVSANVAAAYKRCTPPCASGLSSLGVDAVTDRLLRCAGQERSRVGHVRAGWAHQSADRQWATISRTVCPSPRLRRTGPWAKLLHLLFLMAVVETDDLPPMDPDDFVGVESTRSSIWPRGPLDQQHSGEDVEQVRIKSTDG